jgi:uncharacterized protein (DUF2235 family)
MKRLIVCCDGTWQDLGQRYPTNVVKIAQTIKPFGDDGAEQIVFYDEGIGCGQGVPLARKIESIGGGAVGWGIDHKIQDAYRFLCLNYSGGDEIYLVGFSRGSYIVRSLAGLIYNSGLLRRECIRHIPPAYELYRNRLEDAKPNSPQAIQFRKDFGVHSCPPGGDPAVDWGRVPIKALCCWDTVRSLGLPNLRSLMGLDRAFQKRYAFYDHRINPLIESAFHAMAIDEIRAVFNVVPMEPCAACNPNQVRQMWFCGTHGCIGGGEQPLKGLSDIALAWMLEQLKPLGLALDETLVEDPIHPDYQIAFNNQPQGIYRWLGKVSRPVTGGCAVLHGSVLQRWNDPDLHYRPQNLQPLEAQLSSVATAQESVGNQGVVRVNAYSGRE